MSSTTDEITPEADQPRLAFRRRNELGLLLFSCCLVVALEVLATIGVATANGHHRILPQNFPYFVVAVFGLALVVHFANSLFVPYADPTLLPIASLLNGIGYVMIKRLQPDLANLQAVWTAIGVGGYVLTLLVVKRTRDLDRYRYLLALGGAFLLLTPLVPHFGQDINGARLWVKLGPLTFQPVEIAKIALVIFFASYLTEKRELMSRPTIRIGNHLVTDPRPFGPVLIAWGASILIMTAERDIGFSTLVFSMFVMMLWISTDRTLYLVVAAILLIAGAWGASHLFSQVNERVAVWLDPWAHPATTGYQMVQSEFALGRGGLTGTGIGLGIPGRIPVVASDFIFAAIGEELGLVGTTTVMVAYLLVVGIGIRIALSAKSEFAKLLAAGLTVTFGLQAIFIMGGVVRLMPLTGLTLPFVAYGGSSLVANYVLFGILMRTSNEAASP